MTASTGHLGGWMELRQLRWFIAAVEAGSISAAARDGHVSQPALSVSTAQLERELNATLLTRSRDGVRPTPAGRAVAGIARRVMEDVELAAELVRAAEAPTRRIRLAMIEQVGAPAVTAGMVALATAGLEVEFVRGHRPWAIDGLLTGELDLAVVAGPITRPGIRTQVIRLEPRGVLVGPLSDLFDARDDDLTFELVSRHPAVDPIGLPVPWMDEWSYFSQMNGQRLRRIGPPVDSVNATLVSVMTTSAMAFVPRGFGLLGAGFGLHYLEVRDGPPCTHLLAWRDPVSPAVRIFVDAVRSAASTAPSAFEP